MMEIDSFSEQTCPSCGAPRLEHAWDCGKCGVVFDGAAAQHQAPGSDPVPDAATPRSAPRKHSAARRSSSARRPGSLRPKATVSMAGAGLTAIRDWVDQNKAVAVILSFVLYVVVVWAFGAVIIGATDSPGAIKNAYRDLTGRPLPDGFGPTFAAHFVSRRLVVLDRPDQVILVLYRDEDGASDGELQHFVKDALDILEIPWEKIRTRSASVSGGRVEVPVLRLLGEGGPHLYLIPVAMEDGGRGIEVVVGPPQRTLDVVEEMVRDR